MSSPRLHTTLPWLPLCLAYYINVHRESVNGPLGLFSSLRTYRQLGQHITEPHLCADRVDWVVKWRHLIRWKSEHKTRSNAEKREKRDKREKREKGEKREKEWEGGEEEEKEREGGKKKRERETEGERERILKNLQQPALPAVDLHIPCVGVLVELDS